MRDYLAECECKWFALLISPKLQLISLLHLYRTPGEPTGRQILVVHKQLTTLEIMQDTVIAKRKPAESDHDCDKFVQSARAVGCREADCGRHKDDGMICVVELDTISVHKANGHV